MNTALSKTITNGAGISTEGRKLAEIDDAELERMAAGELSAMAEAGFAALNRDTEDASHDDSEKKPVVVLPGKTVTITQSAEEIYKLIAPTHRLFIRGNVVVYLGKNNMEQLVLEPLLPSAARSFFERFARFVALRAGRSGEMVLKADIMPEETARAILDCHIAAESLPRINGLVNCAVLVDSLDGLRVIKKGYDPETGLLIIRGNDPPEVSLKVALNTLQTMLADFHFQTPADLSRAFASIITPALKMGGLIEGNIPVDVREANESQAGKGHGQKMVCAVYGEQPAIVTVKNGGVGGMDESFCEKLVNGRPFIQLDNLRGAINSCLLESFLTAEGTFPARVPHRREVEVDPSRFFVQLTSNGVESTPDLANRSSIIRIIKRKGVQFPDNLGEIVQRQEFFLGCVFAIVREWHRQGGPRTKETRHDFRSWCQPVDWIIQNIAGLAPLMDGHRAAQVRVSNPALTWLRAVALAVEGESRLGLALIASELVEVCELHSVEIPGRPADEDRAKRQVGSLCKQIFREGDMVEVDGFTVTRGRKEYYKARGDLDYTNAYTFTK
jgi:hypothetical protein